jgi:hypothetical protein
MIKVDKELLKKQINALLESNLDEDTKSGLHNLLGEILDDNFHYNKEIITHIKRLLGDIREDLKKLE